MGSGRDSVTSAAEGGNLGTTGQHYGIFQGVSYTPCNMAILHSFSFSHVNPLTSLPDGLRGGFS